MISNILPTFTSLITLSLLSPVSPSWFVAQMTVYRVYCPIVARQLCSVQYTILQLLPYLTLPRQKHS